MQARRKAGLSRSAEQAGDCADRWCAHVQITPEERQQIERDWQAMGSDVEVPHEYDDIDEVCLRWRDLISNAWQQCMTAKPGDDRR